MFTRSAQPVATADKGSSTSMENLQKSFQDALDKAIYKISSDLKELKLDFLNILQNQEESISTVEDENSVFTLTCNKLEDRCTELEENVKKLE